MSHAAGSAAALASLGLSKEASRVYKKYDFQGIRVHVDRPKGYEKTFTLPDGSKKVVKYKHDYGYVPGVIDHDGEALDVYRGPDGKSDRVFIAEKLKTLRNGKKVFDEHKVFLGFRGKADARRAFNHHISPKMLHKLRETTVGGLKALLAKKKIGAPST